MTGQGPYGGVEMGGMFTTLKVRKEQKPADYTDPGWYKQPAGTQAYEWTEPLAEPQRFKSEGGQSMPVQTTPGAKPATAEVKVRKPAGHSGH